MFQFSSFAKSLVALFFIAGIIIAVSKFAGPAQEKASSVLGVHIAAPQADPLPQRLQADVASSLNDVKKKGMQTNVNDVVGFASRAKKIVTDYQNAQNQLEYIVNDFFKKQDKEKKVK